MCGFRLWAPLLAVFSTAGGCATLTGLDRIQEVNCAPRCGDGQSSTDAMAEGDATPQDATPQEEDAAATDTSVGPLETGPTADAAIDAPDLDASPEDVAGDQMMDANPGDAVEDTGALTPVDSGCGPLTTSQHCGACGVACPAQGATITVDASDCVGSASGNGATCTYACAPGYLDCNASLLPNTDGCECHAPGATTASCCSTACPVLHNDGLNSSAASFYDCVPPNSITLQLASDACVHLTGSPAMCVTGQCVDPIADAATGDLVVCARTANDCSCWTYRGPNSGYVHESFIAGQCQCSDGALGTDARFF